MRVAFLGGGTGGHVAPGVAVARELRRAGHETLFLIAGRPVERALLAPHALSCEELFGDRSRPGPFDVLAWARATVRWRAAIRRYDPQSIVVLGGWVSVPAVLTGFFGRHSVLVEQNARPGKVQRLLARRVEHACLAVDAPDMPRGRLGTHVTGNPVSPLDAVDRRAAARALDLSPERATLLLMGGSQGAADLNALLPAIVDVLLADGRPWQVLHICGEQATAAVPTSGDVPVTRRAFVADMASAWCLADVAVCRAGAGTIAELACSGTPSVLVPYPHHADRHQAANAEGLVRAGGAFIVPPDDPSGRRSVPELLGRALTRLPEMGAAARGQARPRAAAEVAAIVLATGAR